MQFLCRRTIIALSENRVEAVKIALKQRKLRRVASRLQGGTLRKLNIFILDKTLYFPTLEYEYILPWYKVRIYLQKAKCRISSLICSKFRFFVQLTSFMVSCTIFYTKICTIFLAARRRTNYTKMTVRVKAIRYLYLSFVGQ